MRIRTIKPEFWRSDDITALGWATRLLFIGLWSYVDDNGVGIGSDARVGLGTISMEERAAELGGTCRIGASPLGGTQVAVSIPSRPVPAHGSNPTPPPQATTSTPSSAPQPRLDEATNR